MFENSINTLTRNHGVGDTRKLIVTIDDHEWLVQRNDPKLTLSRFAFAAPIDSTNKSRVFNWNQKVQSWRQPSNV